MGLPRQLVVHLRHPGARGTLSRCVAPAGPRYRWRMTATSVTFRDLSRDPGEVARGLIAWERGDPADAAVLTLAASARDLTNVRYTLWIWTGQTPDDEPAWVLPIPAQTAVAFAPKPTAAMLVRCIATAALDLEADPARMRLEEWRGFVCLVLPGLDEEWAAVALEDAHPSPGCARIAALPPEVRLAGPPLVLPAGEGAAGDPLTILAHELSVHPVAAVLALIERDLPLDGDPEALAASLRDWSGPAEPEPVVASAPSLAIADDPCPLRRHARVVLQRMLRMGKVGVGYHTDISNFARGAAAHERHQALDVGEALLRAGLLGEKPSVGQRHIYLNVKALPEIHALIERGETRDPQLAAVWTAPAPTEPRAPSP